MSSIFTFMCVSASGRFKTGENLYWYYTTDSKYNLNPDMALESWFGENANFTYGPLQESDFDNSKNYQIGHYTQVCRFCWCLN